MPSIDAYVGEAHPWEQEVVIPVSTGWFKITPASGKLVISYQEPDSTEYYWDGADFVATYTELATTIVGTVSRYEFTIPVSATGKQLLYTGWVNDDKATQDMHYVAVQRTAAARLRF